MRSNIIESCVVEIDKWNINFSLSFYVLSFASYIAGNI